MAGLFLSLDGIDGGGKSTQLVQLAQWLRESGCDVVTCRDPGSTQLGDALREILLQRTEIALAPASEMLLYMAARAQLVAEVIHPALAAGQVVLSDRFLLANVVYQGHAGGLDPQTIWQVGRIATGGLSPDLTLVLDLPEETALARLRRPLDRLEQRGLDYLRKLRRGYQQEAAADPQRVQLVNADRGIDEIQAELRRLVSAQLPAAAPQQGGPSHP